jgi:hypothetical protein
VYKKSLGILLSITLFSSAAYADNNAQYDNMAKQLSLQLQASMKVMNDPKLIKSSAKYAKNLYNAFIAEGFSKEQSLQLVIASLASKK